MKNLILKVTPYGSSDNYYIIKYHTKITGFWSFLNLFIPWDTLYRTFHSGLLTSYPDKYHPVLYENFNEAVRVAERYKENPELLEDFIKKEHEKYKQICIECDEYQNKRRKSKII